MKSNIYIDDVPIDKLKFIQFIEHNDNEGESWCFWLQVNGNKEQLEKLKAAIWNYQYDEDYTDLYDFCYVDIDDEKNYLTEHDIDFLNKHDISGGYFPMHNICIGKLVLPEDIKLDEDDIFYKGGIQKFFIKD